MSYQNIIIKQNNRIDIPIMKYKTILIDLDGVLNTYNGNFNQDEIPAIKAGAYEFLTELSKEYNIKIFTTRNKILASKWLIENKLDKIVLDVTNTKELCWLYIDDRCITFNGDYNSLKEEITNFRPWYKLTENKTET